MKIIITVILLILQLCVIAQTQGILTFDEYMTIVKNEHPVSYQAQLLLDIADSQKKIARGGFDPKIEASWDHKSFDDKNYWSVASGALKVPTWFGVDLKAGYDRTNGEFLDESDNLPSRGLWSAGISVPLGKGLVIDERRAELKKADIYRTTSEQERILLLNELIYGAAVAYIEWQATYQYADIAAEGVELATTRLDGTRSSFFNGDKPAIDTLESFISLQTRQLDLQKAEQNLTNATLTLNNYLWAKGIVPLELDDGLRPQPFDPEILAAPTDSLAIIQQEWISQHPNLLMYDLKIDALNIDRRLAREDLKPDLRIDYQPLVGVADDALFDQVRSDNYKIGATLSYPILQRKERGKLQLARQKIRGQELERALKNQELLVKLDTYINNMDQTRSQFALLNKTVANYYDLLTAENRKFSLGESSIFLVNRRESKYLESRYMQIGAARKLLINRFTYLMYTSKLIDLI